ncbi:uncharacterized protein CCOS01_08479 [Colletotrichum costaricense]|uniref:Uncharacterized protein n=1 Tax=Colletotrichum costaricense TaxID=1209916 RepID=A0AAJ0E0P7_9PEZI|nr:uncharacterized protein CCOS01_08479 [Colletotrichum costaricense]KAK1526061.1 hypothetical protein CCOS01_08479 [Colletotrichum costaricense]
MCHALWYLRDVLDDPVKVEAPYGFLGYSYRPLSEWPGSCKTGKRKALPDAFAEEVLRAASRKRSSVAEGIRLKDAGAIKIWEATWAVSEMVLDVDSWCAFLTKIRSGHSFTRKDYDDACLTIWEERSWV